MECIFGGCVEIFGENINCWQPNVEAATCFYTSTGKVITWISWYFIFSTSINEESTSSHISPTSITLKRFSTDLDISGQQYKILFFDLFLTPVVVNSTSVKSVLILMSSPLVSSVKSSYILSSSLISMITESISPSG